MQAGEGVLPYNRRVETGFGYEPWLLTAQVPGL
jgi:hypothetical protein